MAQVSLVSLVVEFMCLLQQSWVLRFTSIDLDRLKSIFCVLQLIVVALGPPKNDKLQDSNKKKELQVKKSGASYGQKRGVVFCFFSDVVFLCVEKSHPRVPLDPRS